MSEFFALAGLGTLAAGILPALLTLVICLVLIRLAMNIIGRLLDRSHLDPALKGFVKTASRILLWILGGLVFAESLGIETSSLVAVVSVAGLALSLALQNIMGNLFSGLTLLITRPFKAEDWVEIGANAGTVKSVGLFYTVLSTGDNKEVSIPNGDVTAASVTNYSAQPLRRVDLSYQLSYDSAVADVRAALQEAVAADDRILSDPAPFIAVSAYRDSTVEYLLRVWCHTEDYWGVYFDLNERVPEYFAAHQVSMTYPHLMVQVEKP